MAKTPSRKKLRVAISTGGGDAPGLNAVIRAVVLSAHERGWTVVGIRDGFDGLLEPARFLGGGVVPLDRVSVRGITHLGGTMLGTTNRGNPFRYVATRPDGTTVEVDRSGELVAALKREKIDALISVGGDGSLSIAHDLAKLGVRVIGVPKTIDNDLEETAVTFGFDTAASFATEALDRLHSTAESHRRVMVVEVMGRYAGWIGLASGIAATADVILIPEIPYDIEKVCAKIEERERLGRGFSIVVVAEGALPRGGARSTIGKNAGGIERLGGIGERVTREIENRTGKECRTVVLGHLQRGGMPTFTDRLIALRFGAAAIRAIEEGKTDIMVALAPPTVRYVPLSRAIRRCKTVQLDCDTMKTARDLGISFGD